MADAVARAVEDALREVLAEAFAEQERLPEQTLYNLGVDSIRFVRLMVLLEAALGIEFEDQELDVARHETLGTFLSFVRGKVQGGERFAFVDLAPHFTGTSFSTADALETADLTGLGSSYPAEDLPGSHEIFDVEGIPFRFPSKEPGALNNVDMNHQVIRVEQPGRYARLHVLGVAENGSFQEKIELCGGASTAVVTLSLSEMLSAVPRYGERVAIRCNALHSQLRGVMPNIRPAIWAQTIDLSHLDFAVDTIKFAADNPCMHVFAITLEKGEGASC